MSIKVGIPAFIRSPPPRNHLQLQQCGLTKKPDVTMSLKLVVHLGELLDLTSSMLLICGLF